MTPTERSAIFAPGMSKKLGKIRSAARLGRIERNKAPLTKPYQNMLLRVHGASESVTNLRPDTLGHIPRSRLIIRLRAAEKKPPAFLPREPTPSCSASRVVLRIANCLPPWWVSARPPALRRQAAFVKKTRLKDGSPGNHQFSRTTSKFMARTAPRSKSSPPAGSISRLRGPPP